MLKHELYPQRLLKMWAAAAVVGILAVIAISSPTDAATYTLKQLIDGQDFTIGDTKFSGWTFDSDDSTVIPSQITIDTIDDPNLPGFRVNGNGQLDGDEAKLVYTFNVSTVSALMAGGLLWLTSFEAPVEEGEIGVNLRDDSVETGLELEVFVNRGFEGTRLLDAAVLSDPVKLLEFDAEVLLDLNDPGILRVDTYETRIIIAADTDPVTIGGNVTGLVGSGLVLQNNGGDDETISGNGSFTFSTPLTPGSSYNVTVATDPSNPDQTCSVANGSGTVPSQAVTNVAVTCEPPEAPGENMAYLQAIYLLLGK